MLRTSLNPNTFNVYLDTYIFRYIFLRTGCQEREYRFADIINSFFIIFCFFEICLQISQESNKNFKTDFIFLMIFFKVFGVKNV